MQSFRSLACATLAVSCALAPLAASAHSGGMTGVGTTGCPACHFGGVTPTVTVTPSATQVSPGQTINITVKVTVPNKDANGKGWAGFDLVPADGTLTAAGADTQVFGSEGTHTAPKVETGTTGFVTFTMQWTAPSQIETVSFLAWGNAVNHSFDPTGDDASSGTASVGVCGTVFPDNDGDGFGGGAGMSACSLQNGFVTMGGDCNDANANVHPGASEACNGADDNCNGQVDENAGPLWFRDADGDTFGTSTQTTQACTAPNGFVANGTDCDDTKATTHPGATETCNMIDDDCDGQIDEGIGSTWFADSDGDGFGNPQQTKLSCTQPPGYVADSTDCDDTKSSTHPGASELCNMADDDCDGMVDESVTTVTFFKDQDNDGFGGTQTTMGCAPPPGYVTLSGDCDDTNAAVKPTAIETCNMIDDDCDGQIDEAVKTTFFKDGDGDTFGDPTQTVDACTAPTGYVPAGTDCDDTDATIHPGATELCDDIDQNCDGTKDEGLALSSCGLGACVATGTSCLPSSCTPGMTQVETCNGIDDDCNGVVDDDPAALCPGTDVCQQGVCAPPPPEDAGMPDAGAMSDAGQDAGSEADGGTGTDGGGGGGELGGGGCTCADVSGSAVAAFGVLAIAVLGRRRRRA